MKKVNPKDIKPGFYWATAKKDMKSADLSFEFILKVHGKSPFLKYSIWDHQRDRLPDMTIDQLTFIAAFK
jgi:hypothetical protein